MAYAGRQNIYEATIRRMVTQALEAREEEFARLHREDTPQQLLLYLRGQAQALGRSPWPGEIDGGSFLEARFGSWERALLLAGLPKPNTPNKPAAFQRVAEETEAQKLLYRRKKAEKKALAEQRRIQQAKKRAADK